VPVTGSSVSVELLHRQLDLVTGIAALLAVDMRERAPFAHALGLVAGQDPIWPPAGRSLSRSQPHMPHVSASRPNSFSRRAEPPPRSPNRSGRHQPQRSKSCVAMSACRRPPIFPPALGRLHAHAHICWVARTTVANDLESGAIVTIARERMRVRPLPIVPGDLICPVSK
jgi:hypothetical protein